MDAYRIKDSGGDSLTCKQVEHAVKKFRGASKGFTSSIWMRRINKNPLATFGVHFFIYGLS